MIYKLWKTLSPSKIGKHCQGIYIDFSMRIYLDLRAHNKFKMLDLFISVNFCFKPQTKYHLGTHQYL
jgi:hypothetical protein